MCTGCLWCVHKSVRMFGVWSLDLSFVRRSLGSFSSFVVVVVVFVVVVVVIVVVFGVFVVGVGVVVVVGVGVGVGVVVVVGVGVSLSRDYRCSCCCRCREIIKAVKNLTTQQPFPHPEVRRGLGVAVVVDSHRDNGGGGVVFCCCRKVVKGCDCHRPPQAAKH